MKRTRFHVRSISPLPAFLPVTASASYAKVLALLILAVTNSGAGAQQSPDPFRHTDWTVTCQPTWCQTPANRTFDTWSDVGQYGWSAYTRKGGYELPNYYPGYDYVCGPAAPVQGNPYSSWSGWVATVEFQHAWCRWRNRATGQLEDNASRGNGHEGIHATCEPNASWKNMPDSYAYCVRSPNDCLKYPDNKAFGCGKTVAAMEAVAKAADDPTRVFHQTQTCIARKSCDLRCRMDNCKWMDRVIPDFVNPYLQKTGNWSALESVCQLVKLNYRSYGVPIVGDLLCAEAMAEYHIEVDLVAAMTATGCGSDNDWSLVYQQIQTCSGDTQTTLLGGWPDAAKNAGADYAAWKVRKLRDKARVQCVANRTAAGLDPEMNPAEKGKVCLQP